MTFLEIESSVFRRETLLEVKRIQKKSTLKNGTLSEIGYFLKKISEIAVQFGERILSQLTKEKSET